ncbi:hypothetical protein OHR68_07090 [Spirillospora sp. NBC_00431]
MATEAEQPVGWLLVAAAAVIGMFAVLAVVAGLRALFTSDQASRTAGLIVLLILLELFRWRRR